MGNQCTPYLKIKLDANLPHARAVLECLDKRFPVLERAWSVDANAAWNPQTALEFLQLLKEFSPRILMVEQPFPVDVGRQIAESGARLEQEWAGVRKAYNQAGILIYADESVHTHRDLAALSTVADGVNVKMEKAGGVRGAIRTLTCAKQLGMRTWVGCMVGGTHNSSVTASLLQLADHGDLDGSLLVTPASDKFTGGFKWGTGGQAGRIILSPEVGVGTQHRTL